MSAQAADEQVRALDEGRAFTLPPVHAMRISGPDAAGWLNDLVTAGVRGLRDGQAVRSLLLTPTGRIRADFHVLATDGTFLLVQDARQPERAIDLLAPYVLSSQVRLDEEPNVRPAFVPAGDDWDVTLRAPRHLLEASLEAAEVWRIRRGIARFPVDVDGDSLPAEAGLERLVDFAKGCFLGQESVAKVRNLGHPPVVVLGRRGPAGLAPGDIVMAAGERVGALTSVAPDGRGTSVLARVRWEARDLELATGDGRGLTES